MIAALDILQSIPVLSFLPGVMLAMVALVPTRQLGVEMGAIILIFTGQVWNMAFSFYSSLKSLPKELGEASRIYGFSTWQRFWQLELPYAAIGLIWNSMISVAGGWFFLMACEMFVLGDRDFRLPGLGSYLQTAASANNVPAMVYGILTVIAIIVATDQLIWRPIIAWSDKFKIEQTSSSNRVDSPILHLLQNSNALLTLRKHTLTPLSESISRTMAERHTRHRARLADSGPAISSLWLRVPILIALSAVILYAAGSALLRLHEVHRHEVLLILEGASATFLRVNLSLLLAAAWTIPAGVAIGLNPKLARIVQPIVQGRSVISRADSLPDHPARSHPAWRRPRHRLHSPDAARNAVVYPVQRRRRSHGHPLRPPRGFAALPFHPLAALADGHSARDLPVSCNRTGYSIGRSLECQHHRRVLSSARTDSPTPSAWAHRSAPQPTAASFSFSCSRRSSWP